ncbi:MAG TPA: glycosyltransferase [Armatimonadota bacterium]
MVSVVLPVYNGATHLAEAMDSILCQTYPNLEVVAVDDGSTDSSLSLLQEYARVDSRVRVLSRPHQGLPAVMKHGAGASRGNLIAHQHQDDVALPQRLEAQVDHLQSERLDVSSTWIERFGASQGLGLYPTDHEAIRRELVFSRGMLSPTLLMRREVALDDWSADRACCGACEPWVHLASRYRLGVVPRVLLRYRIHPGQTSAGLAHCRTEAKRELGLRHLRSLYPELTSEDEEAMGRVLASNCQQDRRALALAARWLARLIEPTDEVLRLRMARRWLAACLASAPLGPCSWREYHQAPPRVRDAQPRERASLLLRSLLRRPMGSRAVPWLSKAGPPMQRAKGPSATGDSP